MVTCVKLIPRKAVAPECEPFLAGLEPIKAGGAAVRVGIVADALSWLDRNLYQRRSGAARLGAKPGQHLYTALLRGSNADGSRVHVHVDDYPERVTLGGHADAYEVFIAVVRGACWVGYHEGGGAARRAVQREVQTGNIVLKPAGANLTITTRPGQTVRLLVLEMSAARKHDGPPKPKAS